MTPHSASGGAAGGDGAARKASAVDTTAGEAAACKASAGDAAAIDTTALDTTALDSPAGPTLTELPRLAVLISGRGSNMQALVAATRDGTLPMQVVGIVADRPQAAGLEWARAQGLPTRLVDHRQFADRAAFDAALADTTAALAPDLVALAGFMRVLTPAFIRRFAGRILNIHPSLLPAFPGLHTHRRALQARVAVHGATVHRVIEELDAGEPIAQAVVPVLDDDDEESLAARVLAMEHRLYTHALRLLINEGIAAQSAASPQTLPLSQTPSQDRSQEPSQESSRSQMRSHASTSASPNAAAASSNPLTERTRPVRALIEPALFQPVACRSVQPGSRG